MILLLYCCFIFAWYTTLLYSGSDLGRRGDIIYNHWLCVGGGRGGRSRTLCGAGGKSGGSLLRFVLVLFVLRLHLLSLFFCICIVSCARLWKLKREGERGGCGGILIIFVCMCVCVLSMDRWVDGLVEGKEEGWM